MLPDRIIVAKLLHRLCAKRWVERLERGKYLIIPLEAGPKGDWAEHEYLVAASLVEPYYLAYGTALNTTTAVARNVILSDRRPALSNVEGERRISLLRCNFKSEKRDSLRLGSGQASSLRSSDLS